MLKRLGSTWGKRFLVILAVVIAAWLIYSAYHIGVWRGLGKAPWSRPRETVYVTDTIPATPPPSDDGGHPFWWYLGHKKAQVDTEWVVATPDWLPDVWMAYNIRKEGDKLYVEYYNPRKEETRKRALSDVPNNWYAYGTETNFEVEHGRFNTGWFTWEGLSVGTRIETDGKITPTIVAGIRVKRVYLRGGITTNGGFVDCFLRVF